MSSELGTILKLDDDEDEKVYYVFGHDIRRITCFRFTMITSLSASVVTTLGSFLFTSDGVKSARLGLWTCSMLMLPLWLHCARKNLKEAEALKLAERRFKERSGEEFTYLDSLESFSSDSYG